MFSNAAVGRLTEQVAKCTKTVKIKCSWSIEHLVSLNGSGVEIIPFSSTSIEESFKLSVIEGEWIGRKHWFWRRYNNVCGWIWKGDAWVSNCTSSLLWIEKRQCRSSVYCCPNAVALPPICKQIVVGGDLGSRLVKFGFQNSCTWGDLWWWVVQGVVSEQWAEIMLEWWECSHLGKNLTDLK